LFYATAAVRVLQSFSQVFLMVMTLPRLLVLSETQLNSWNPISQWNWVKTVFLLSFLFDKGMTDRVPVKGNSVDSGPSLVTETLSW